MDPSGRIEGRASRPHFLVIKLSSLGDLFHALPAVQTLQVARQAVVDWVAQPEYTDLVACFGGIRRVIPFPRRQFGAAMLPFLWALRAERYDVILDFQGLLKSALVSRLARGNLRLGPSFAREGTRVFYSRLAGERRRDRHAIDECLDFTDALGIPRGEGRPILPFRFPPFPMPKDAPRPRIAVSPVTRWASKNWPLRHLTDVLQSLGQRIGGSVHLIGGAMDRTLYEGVGPSLSQPVYNWAGILSLPELGSLLAQMDLMIASDTGPMHMAAALSVPVVAAFGPTDPGRTGPYGVPARVVVKEGLACRPCFQRRCRLDEEAPPCLRDLDPGAVVEAAVTLLSSVLGREGERPNERK